MTSSPSLADIARSPGGAMRAHLRGAFAVEIATSVAMHMPERAWAEAAAAFRAPRASVERQTLIIARDLLCDAEALVNPLRALRAPRELAPRAGGAQDQRRHPCGWCDMAALHVSRLDLSVDEFGAVYAANGRVRAGPNWARQAPISGVVFGDHAMHDLLALTRADFRALFEAAEGYIARATAAFPEIRYYTVFVNGGERSAASVRHAHAQIAGRGGRHFAYAEAIASRAPSSYWDIVRSVHENLGLAAEFADGIAWANLVPLKERDITAFSATLPGGAEMIHAILQQLIANGTDSFSLAAILAPANADGGASNGSFRNWPPVLWRLVDRGSAHQRHADIGCLELFGTGVVATDPFEVARWIVDAATSAAKG